MARVLLIGYGNALRGDDALGVRAAERLRGLLSEAREAEVIACHQLAPELAEPLSRCELALFMDATSAGEPGSVCVQPLSAEDNNTASLTHHATPAALLALAHELYGHSPKAMLITGTGANFKSGEGLSDAGSVALEEICQTATRLVRECSGMQRRLGCE